MRFEPQQPLPRFIKDAHQHREEKVRTTSSLRLHSFLYNSDACSENTTKTFHQFPQLPLEIQLSIWRLALPRFRILQPILDRGGDIHCFPLCRNPRPPPPQDPSILQVNQQSRSEARQFFHPRNLDHCSSSTSNVIANSNPSRRPCKYISPRFDILYFDSLLEFEPSEDCFSNVLARCDSVDEMLVCENLALRLKNGRNIGERFFIWLLVWICWFPRLMTVWVVVDDVMDEWELIKVEKNIMMASWRARERLRDRMKESEELKILDVGRKEWMVPDVEVISRVVFETVWWRDLGSAWPVDSCLKPVKQIEEGHCTIKPTNVEETHTHGRLIERRDWWDVVVG